MRVATLCALFCTGINALPLNSEGLANIEIRQTLSRSALALDGKDFGALSNVFTPDAIGRFGDLLPPPNDVVRGLPAIQEFLKSQLEGFETQHTISTTVVDFTDKHSPNSTAYLVANYFGQGNLTGQIVSFYGRYHDQWRNQGGVWKTKNRRLVLFPPGIIGNRAILGAPSG